MPTSRPVIRQKGTAIEIRPSVSMALVHLPNKRDVEEAAADQQAELPAARGAPRKERGCADTHPGQAGQGECIRACAELEVLGQQIEREIERHAENRGDRARQPGQVALHPVHDGADPVRHRNGCRRRIVDGPGDLTPQQEHHQHRRQRERPDQQPGLDRARAPVGDVGGDRHGRAGSWPMPASSAITASGVTSPIGLPLPLTTAKGLPDETMPAEKLAILASGAISPPC